MAKYLIHGSYSEDGLKGLLKEGGSARMKAGRKTVESLGGTVEASYFAFGGDDFYYIVDLPDNADSAAVALTVNASGAVKVKTTVLLTPEEVDEAVEKSVDYRPPGR